VEFINLKHEEVYCAITGGHDTLAEEVSCDCGTVPFYVSSGTSDGAVTILADFWGGERVEELEESCTCLS
jgi:hypothetical protein